MAPRGHSHRWASLRLGVAGPLVVRSAIVAAVIVGALATCAPDTPPLDREAHRADVEQWRQERVADLDRPDNWLALVGLYWLREGPNSFGSGADNDFVFEGEGVPAHIGTFHLAEGQVHFEAAESVSVTHRGEPVQRILLSPDSQTDSTDLSLGSLTWYVLSRSGRAAVRLMDGEATTRTDFQGIESFAIDPAWYFNARFDRYDPPRSIQVPNILGTVSEQTSSGAVVFRVQGETHRLNVTGDPDDERFFVVFGDATNGDETYGGGRYVWIDAPDERGRVVIDFNKAYNPPCVFTDYATCPLPTRENRLAVRVEAGEKMYETESH